MTLLLPHKLKHWLLVALGPLINDDECRASSLLAELAGVVPEELLLVLRHPALDQYVVRVLILVSAVLSGEDGDLPGQIRSRC